MYLNRLVLMLLISINLTPPAFSQMTSDYPLRPVRVVNPSSLGGGGDVVARILTPELSRLLGQNFYVDNHPGAANIIATEIAAKAPADGYTLYLAATGTFVTNPLVYAKLPYSLSSFQTISNVADAPFILSIHPSLPALNFKELLNLAKQQPGQLTYASFGKGSTPHLAGEMLQVLTGIRLIHVPYKGSAPGMADLIGGNITMTFDAGMASIAQIRAKRIRPIGVAASKRLDVLSDLPTLEEQGLKQFYAGSWYGFMAPAATHRPIIVKVYETLIKALHQPRVEERIHNLGASVGGSTPEAFFAQIQAEQLRWAEVVNKAGIKPE